MRTIQRWQMYTVYPSGNESSMLSIKDGHFDYRIWSPDLSGYPGCYTDKVTALYHHEETNVLVCVTESNEHFKLPLEDETSDERISLDPSLIYIKDHHFYRFYDPFTWQGVM